MYTDKCTKSTDFDYCSGGVETRKLGIRIEFWDIKDIKLLCAS